MRNELRSLVSGHLSKLIDQRGQTELLLQQDPGLPARERERSCSLISDQIKETKNLLEACTPYVSKMRSLVPEITDRTLEAACYLLFSQALQNFHAILLLAPEGFHHQIVELLRGIREAIDLTALFMCEGLSSAHLKKWFKGEIISNDAARRALDRFINEGRNDLVPVAETKSGIYGGFSQFNHMSYIGLLESINPFSRDFDASRDAGLHFSAAAGLSGSASQLRSMVVALKQFYALRGDGNSFRELDQIFRSSTTR